MAFRARSSLSLFSHLISGCFTSEPLEIPSPIVTESRLQGGGDRDVWLMEVLLCGYLFRRWLRPRCSTLPLAILARGPAPGQGIWPDCSYPKVPCSKLLFACWFINLFSLFLLLCFSHSTKRSHWGKWWLFPRPIVSSWTRRVPFDQYPVGLYLVPPLSVSHLESSGFTFNHSWCGLFRVFYSAETLQLFLMPKPLSLSKSPPWKPLSFTVFQRYFTEVLFGLTCTIKISAD